MSGGVEYVTFTGPCSFAALEVVDTEPGGTISDGGSPEKRCTPLSESERQWAKVALEVVLQVLILFVSETNHLYSYRE